MKTKIFFFAVILMTTGMAFATSSYPVVPAANDSLLHEHSPYLTHFWYDGLLSHEWRSLDPNTHPIWLTYIETSTENDKVIARNFKLYYNQDYQITEKQILSDTTVQKKRSSPLLENYLLNPVAVWIESDADSSCLMYTRLYNNQWLPAQKLNFGQTTASLPVFTTMDALDAEDKSDSLNRLFWVSDSFIYAAEFNNFQWHNIKTIYTFQDSVKALSARIDWFENIWLLFEEKGPDDSLSVNLMILPKDSTMWKGPYSLLKIHGNISQACLNFHYDCAEKPIMLLNWVDENKFLGASITFQQDSINIGPLNSFFSQPESDFKFISNSLLPGGCVITFSPYYFYSYKQQGVTHLNRCQDPWYSELFHSTENSVPNLAMSGFNNQYFVQSWEEFDGKQSDIYLKINFIEVGVDVEQSDKQIVSTDFRLLQNHPNPFNSSTIINYYLPKSQPIELSLYNILGEKLKILYSGNQSKGVHSIKLSSRELTSGVYFYILETGNQTLMKKLLVLK